MSHNDEMGEKDKLLARIAQLEQENAVLHEMAYYDELTREWGVLSRAGFMSRLHARLTEVDENVERHGEPRDQALLYIDLDEFKQVNDTYDHEAGDKVLQAFAAAAQSVLRGSDIIGRIGGDEFAIVAWVQKDHGLERLRQRVQRALALVSVVHGNQELLVSASIGTTLFEPQDGNEPKAALKTAMKRADNDMYEVKRRRKGQSGQQ